MKKHVTATVAEYLGALPYQVEAWDHKVIMGFLDDITLFDAFCRGSDHAKWQIYSAVRHAR